MGWSIGFDTDWQRDIGYGVPAPCDHPGCRKVIDRGLSHVCGGEPYGGDGGCGLYFCSSHLFFRTKGRGHLVGPQLCQRCCEGKEPFEPKKDRKQWMRWKLTDESWAQWRAEHPDEVNALRSVIEGKV